MLNICRNKKLQRRFWFHLTSLHKTDVHLSEWHLMKHIIDTSCFNEKKSKQNIKITNIRWDEPDTQLLFLICDKKKESLKVTMANTKTNIIRIAISHQARKKSQSSFLLNKLIFSVIKMIEFHWTDDATRSFHW